ncbi:MAG: NUDIX domain-containing protein [Bacteroidetes bacterium]|nr:NUDIX domain-containing protein [Bacteroidota bacterium]
MYSFFQLILPANDFMQVNQFNIRVYGFLIEQDNILVTDEFRLGIYMTKFPGGGLQFGEGTIECLKREFMEEMGTEIEIVSHFYTTDFYQPTTLLPSEMQLFNIYYLVTAAKPYRFETTLKRNDIPNIDGSQCFRWIRIAHLKEEDFTFPIDQFIVGELKKWQQDKMVNL